MLKEFSYAAKSIKNYVRLCVCWKIYSAILRQIHDFIWEEPKRFDAEVDQPTQFSKLNLSDNAILFLLILISYGSKLDSYKVLSFLEKKF